MPRAVLALCLTLTFLAIPSAAAPQTARHASPASVINGTVRDASAAPLIGATVTIVELDQTTSVGSTVTDQRGSYRLVVAPGRYALRVGLDGFEESVRVVATTVSATLEADLVLQVATVREAVNVTASAGYRGVGTRTATKTLTPLHDVPQAVTIVTQALIKDQMMMSIGDVMRYVPGVTVHQGESNRDQVIIRGNSSSADFFVDGVRDDVQYYRDLYNLESVETLKGPNAMIFGRGGAGGVVNRVLKTAGPQATRDISLQGGMFGNKRLTAGVNQPLGEHVALRLDSLYENSDSFRNDVGLERHGLTPTLAFTPTAQTKVTLRHEYLDDARVADRGITSFGELPADVAPSTFYGNPDASEVSATVNVTSGTIEHQFGRFTLRNHTLAAHYDRGYQNFVPGAVTANKEQVALTAYNSATVRTNLFNQTDLTGVATTGRLRHTLLAGAEFGRQFTDNFRNTGYFNNAATSLLVPYSSPTISTPVTFRQSATDADNHVRTSVAAAYAQDQVELSRHLQVVGGLRVDRFDLEYRNNRNGDTLSRPDNLVSPRAGVVFKPLTPLSIYSSYSTSYVPSSGDQFASLTIVTEQVKPERIRNYEVGAKWDVATGLTMTTAVYRLDRTNTRSVDPDDPTRIVQTGSQRTNGYELGANGRISSRWSVAGGYAYQDAFVTSATIAAAAGVQVAQVPHHTLSLWNNYQVHPRLGAGLGVLTRSEMFASITNTVHLPGYTRVDAAAFFRLSPAVRLQANLENLLNKAYFINADSNTNISPGSSRAFRVGLTATF